MINKTGTAMPRPSIVPHRTCELARGSLVFLTATLLIGLAAVLCLALLLPQAVRPARGAAPEAEAGLFFKSGRADTLFEAPLLQSDVAIDVSGEIARVTLRQRFRNPSSIWLEGIYVFPLPERSAVDRLVMTVGERRIEGKIMEREEARRVYQAAAQQGRRASLLDSERPNVFVTSVANVGPGDEIQVEIQYQDQVPYKDGRYSLRFPMVVAPRYMPLPSAPSVRAPQPGKAAPRAQPIAAQGKVEGKPPVRKGDLFGPVRHPDEGPANPLSLVVRLDAGFAPAELRSLYHKVEVEALDEHRRVVTLADGSTPADRDFVLAWRPAVGATPEAGVFAEEIDGDSYLLVTLLPPESDAPTESPLPRDLIFVIDSSGSMHGPSIAQAKTALLAALDRLRPADRFNLIRFADRSVALFDGLRPADNRTLLRAASFVGAIEAEGGTEMLPALHMALAEPAREGRLRQVVFLTDGAVGNESALFEVIADRLGGSRLFTIGIGSAPNSYFMREAAELGRGSFTHIGDVGEVAARMEALFRKLERPRLTDLEATFPPAAGQATEKGIESYPAPLPDLYAGEPVSFTAMLPGVALADLEDTLLLTGWIGDGRWERHVPLNDLRSAPGIAALWARAKLAQIEKGLARGRDAEAVRRDALAVGLEHRLVTRYTSLVAVDEEVVRPQDEDLQTGEVARNLPDGWSYEKVFGEAVKAMPTRAASTPLQQAAATGQPLALPQTATPATLQAVTGLALLSLALALLLIVRRANRRLDRAGA